MKKQNQFRNIYFSLLQDPQKSIGTLIDCGLFYILWQQVRAAFRSLQPNDMIEEMPMITTPDWILISRDGIHQLLQLTLELFLQVLFKSKTFSLIIKFSFSVCINV
jgi:hypothetical protein